MSKLLKKTMLPLLLGSMVLGLQMKYTDEKGKRKTLEPIGMAVSNENWSLYYNRNEPQYGIKVHKRTKPSKKRNKNRIKGKKR